MDYRQALDYLLTFADFERSSSSRVRYRDFNLDRVRMLLSKVGDPDRSFRSVHIAGTKGKGSTAAMAASTLRCAGFRTGLYTSPHLHTVRERIAVDGEPISEQELAGGLEELRPAIEETCAQGEAFRVTTFEVLTAVALAHFRRRGAEFAVLEVGLGGRLDATNVVTPVACAITNISLDHTEVLGDTLGKIAAEKAAIIKRGVPVVCAPQPVEALEVIAGVAREQSAPLTLVGRDITWEAGPWTLEGQQLVVRTPRGSRKLWVPLLGAHQRENAATALGVFEALAGRGVALSPEAVREGMARTVWPGRMEVIALRPVVVVDGAHNPYSMQRLREAMEETFPGKRPVVVFGVGKAKDAGSMLAALAGLAGVVVATRSRHPKAMPAWEVMREAALHGLAVEQAETPGRALDRARALAGPDGLVLATGSLFVVAEVREEVKGIEPELYSGSGAVVV